MAPTAVRLCLALFMAPASWAAAGPSASHPHHHHAEAKQLADAQTEESKDKSASDKPTQEHKLAKASKRREAKGKKSEKKSRQADDEAADEGTPKKVLAEQASTKKKDQGAADEADDEEADEGTPKKVLAEQTSTKKKDHGAADEDMDYNNMDDRGLLARYEQEDDKKMDEDQADEQETLDSDEQTEKKADVAGIVGCVTRKDPRSKAWLSKTAKEGTACVFGADPKDEGSHCVNEFEFGTMGWCYTKIDRSEWGPCDDGCPLYGPHHLMGEDIDKATDEITDIVKKLDKVADKLPESSEEKEKKLKETKEREEKKKNKAEEEKKEKKGKKRGGKHEKDLTQRHATAVGDDTEEDSDTNAAALARLEKTAALGARWKHDPQGGAAAGKAAKAKSGGKVSPKKAKVSGTGGYGFGTASLAQTAASRQRSTVQLQVDAAAAFWQKAKKQTDLWTDLAEKIVLGTDNADELGMAKEALSKAMAWQNIAGRAGARVDALLA